MSAIATVADEADPIKTSDTSLAAFLHYNQHYFVGIMQDPNDQHRKVFVFIKQDDSDELQEEYFTGEVTINPKLYYKSIRIMHRSLREDSII
jgi:hypothetical protein